MLAALKHVVDPEGGLCLTYGVPLVRLLPSDLPGRGEGGCLVLLPLFLLLHGGWTSSHPVLLASLKQFNSTFVVADDGLSCPPAPVCDRP